MGHLYAWNDREPFLHGMDRVTVKICGAKLKFGKILHRTETPLRAVDLLVEQAAEAHRVETEAPLLRPVIRVEMELACCMAIDVAIETRDTETRLGTFTIVSRVELFWRKWGQKHAQAIKLDRCQDIFKQAVVIVDGDHFPPRYITELRPVLEKNRWWKLGQKGLREIELHIEAFEAREHGGLHLRKHLATGS